MARSSTTDADAWDVRLAALATLAQYDGLTFVNLASSDASAAYNLVGDPTADPAMRGAVEDVTRSAVTAQLRVSVPLADGRIERRHRSFPEPPRLLLERAKVIAQIPPT